jgi:hypothetical protein
MLLQLLESEETRLAIEACPEDKRYIKFSSCSVLGTNT